MSDALTVRPARAEDILRLSPRRFDRAWLADLAANLPDGPAFTGWVGDQIIMVAGIRPLWHGVGEAWAVSDSALDRHRVKAGRAVLRWLPEVIAGMGLHRVQASVHHRHAQSMRWLEWLGFRPEGLMAGYGPKGDGFWLYGLVRGGA